MDRLRSLDTFRRVTVVGLLLAAAAPALFALAKGLHDVAPHGRPGILVYVIVGALVACLAFAIYITNRDLSPREGGNMPADVQLANVAGIVLLVLPAVLSSAAFFTLTQGRPVLSPLLAVLALAAAPLAGRFAAWIQRRWPPLATE